ncbi:hypothetical protein AAMO2058_000051100 [Amorphochlora amoebiformis]
MAQKRNLSDRRHVRAFILEKLRDLEREFGFKVVYAAERSSHVWGTAHQESDHDVKFLYVYPMRSYCKVEQDPMKMKRVYGPRGTQRVQNGKEDMDVEIAGFDLKQAGSMICRADPTMYEILASPIVYKASPLARQFLPFFCLSRLAQHFFNYGNSHLKMLSREKLKPKIQRKELKMYGYTLRAFLSCLWVVRKANIYGSLVESSGNFPILPLEIKKIAKTLSEQDEARVLELVGLIQGKGTEKTLKGFADRKDVQSTFRDTFRDLSQRLQMQGTKDKMAISSSPLSLPSRFSSSLK